MLKLSYLQPDRQESSGGEMGTTLLHLVIAQQSPWTSGQAAQTQAAPIQSYCCSFLSSKGLSLLSVCKKGEYGIAPI